MQPDAKVVSALLDGPAHSFAEPIAAEVPTQGAGIYTIWDENGNLVYVGVAGRDPPSKTGPAGRLRSHASGRRSGDQFCIDVADHYVLPELTTDQITAIANFELSLDMLVREKIRRSFSFRVAEAPNYQTAQATENWIKSGAAPCGAPRLNPVRTRA
jgi:hypothetical protein